MCQSLFFNKVAGLQACNFIKKRLQHKCFPKNIAKFLRTTILKNICEQLLLVLVKSRLVSPEILTCCKRQQQQKVKVSQCLHYVKSVQIRSFFWSIFSCIRTENGDLYSELFRLLLRKKKNISRYVIVFLGKVCVV